MEFCDGLRVLFGESNDGDDESTFYVGEVSIDSHALFVDWNDLGCLEDDENIIGETEDSLVCEVLNDSHHGSFKLWDGVVRLFREENGIGEGLNSFASEDEGPGDSHGDENDCG